MPTPEYRVLFGNLIDGTVDGEVEAHDLKYSQKLVPPSDMSCWVDMDHPICTRFNLDPGATAMYVERGGLLVWGGILWTAQANSVERKLSLSCTDFWSYFRKRRLRQTRVYTNIDSIAIARDIIDYAQDQPLGSININLGSELSGTLTTDTYAHYERTEIASIVEDLANNIPGGFDFGVQVAWDANGTSPILTMRFWAPRRGRRVEGLVFNHNIQGISNFESDVDATTIANVIDAIGSGDGEAMFIATAVDSSSLGRYPLYEDTISLKDEKSQQHLQGSATWSVKWRALSAEVPSITKDPQIWPDLGSFEPGDEGLVIARSGNWLDLYGYYQVLAWEVTRSDSGKEEMKIDLTEAR